MRLEDIEDVTSVQRTCVVNKDATVKITVEVTTNLSLDSQDPNFDSSRLDDIVDVSVDLMKSDTSVDHVLIKPTT